MKAELLDGDKVISVGTSAAIGFATLGTTVVDLTENIGRRPAVGPERESFTKSE